MIRPWISPSWLFILAIFVADGLIMAYTGTRLAVPGTIAAGAFMLFLVGCRPLCTFLKKRYGIVLETSDSLPAMADISAKFLTAGLAIGPTQYMAILFGRTRPYVDAAMVRIDAALGFDWFVFHNAVWALPVLHAILFHAYDWTLAEVLALLLLNAALGEPRVNLQFFWALTISALICCAVACLIPTVAFDNTNSPAYYVVVDALRHGQWATYDPAARLGLLTFPSYHTAKAVIMIRVALRRLWTALPLIPLNLIIIVSTVPVGGHHLADTIGGLVIAVMIMPLADRLARWEMAPHPIVGAIIRTDQQTGRSAAP
jgi:membrane-associated phospholipid phosphatase